MTSFDLYDLPDDYRTLREAVRAVADAKIAPHAARVDATASFPHEAYEALVASDFHAPHVPAEYGGVGADALATCIVIEEVARACASTSLIPAVNKLGSLPLLLGGADDLKSRYLKALATGTANISYALSERGAGSDVASMRTRATRDNDHWVLSGQKSWITNAGFSDFYTVFAVTDPEGRRGATSARSSCRRTTTASASARRSASSASKAPRPARCCSTTSASPRTG
jgi:alkylation response protein AidB-like acyl-CoA dehydrogenase